MGAWLRSSSDSTARPLRRAPPAWACSTAAATAERLPLRVVTAVEARLSPAASIVRPPTLDDLEAALQSAQEEVDQLLADVEAPVDCTLVAVAGRTAAVLLEEADGADRPVVGAGGRGVSQDCSSGRSAVRWSATRAAR